MAFSKSYYAICMHVTHTATQTAYNASVNNLYMCNGHCYEL